MSGGERKSVDADTAIAALPDGDDVHTFMQGGTGMLLGADWSREDIAAALRKAERIDVTGDQAQSMRHGLAIRHPRADAWLFIETRERTDSTAGISP